MTPVFGATDSLSGMKRIAAVLDTGQVVTSNQTIPLGLLVGRRTLTVTATDVADNVATLVVPFRVRPVFVGVVYDDGNESALREGGEAAIAGLLVFLDTDGNGRPDAGEPSNATNGAGAFRVVGEDVGPARLCTMPVADRPRADHQPLPDRRRRHRLPGAARSTSARGRGRTAAAPAAWRR